MTIELKHRSTALLLVLLSNCCIHYTVQGFTASSPRVCFSTKSPSNSHSCTSSYPPHAYSYSFPFSPCTSSPLWPTSTIAPRQSKSIWASASTSTSLQFQNAQYADDHLTSRNRNLNNPQPHQHDYSHSHPHRHPQSRPPPPLLPNTSDPYVLFNLPRHATKLDIKSAYRQAALIYHPDVRITVDSTVEERQRANDDFARINAAYAILTGKSDAKKVRRNQRGRATTNGYGGTSSEYTPHGYSHYGNGHGSTVGRHPPHHHRRGGANANAGANNPKTSSPSSHHQAQAQAHTYANAHVNTNTKTNPQAHSHTHTHTQSPSQPNPNTHQQHVRTHVHSPVPNTKYSRQGYGGAATNAPGAGPVAGSVPDPVPTRPSYSRQGYGGTSSAYTPSQSTDGVNSSRSRYTNSPSTSHAANGANSVNTANTTNNAHQQNTGRRATVSTKYVRQGYGGTSSSYGGPPSSSPNPSRFTDNGAATTPHGASNTNTNTNTSTNVNTTAPRKRRAAASTQYSRGNYGGTSSSYHGTAGKHSRTVHSSMNGNSSHANTNDNMSANSNAGVSPSPSPSNKKDTRRSGANVKRYYGYGGTSSSFNGASAAYSSDYHVGVDNTASFDPELEERRRKGDFFNPQKFHSQWNTSANGGGGYRTSSATATTATTTNGSGGSSNDNTSSSNQQGNTSVSSSSVDDSNKDSASAPQSYYSEPTVETPEKTRRTTQIPRSGDFFNADDFHSKWNPSTSGTVNTHVDSNTEQRSTASGRSSNKNPSDFTNADKFHSTYSSHLSAEEEERKYNEAVIEAARLRAEEMTAKLKKEESADSNNNSGKLGGFNGIFKSMSNLFSNNTPPSTVPTEKVCRVPRPPQGQQFTPFQACTIIEQHEKDAALDKGEAMRSMLSNHYVPVKRSQLYVVYKKYQQGSILRENRWGQYS